MSTGCSAAAKSGSTAAGSSPTTGSSSGDKVRVPPVRIAAPEAKRAARPVEFPIVFEDASILVIDKPAGVAVHGGSGVS